MLRKSLSQNCAGHLYSASRTYAYVPLISRYFIFGKLRTYFIPRTFCHRSSVCVLACQFVVRASQRRRILALCAHGLHFVFVLFLPVVFHWPVRSVTSLMPRWVHTYMRMCVYVHRQVVTNCRALTRTRCFEYDVCSRGCSFGISSDCGHSGISSTLAAMSMIIRIRTHVM